MRTRIALVAIAPIAVITTTILTQAATVQPARGAAAPPTESTTTTTIVHRSATPPEAVPNGVLARSSLLLDLNAGLLARAAAAAPVPPPPAQAVTAAPPPPASPVDTVTPDQRAAWERVAMCEEGGDWHAESSRFSGGLGISRANWDLFGGREFAPEGAAATEDEQIMVAERIQPEAPDQSGCGSW